MNFEGRQELKDGIKKVNEQQHRMSAWVTGFKGTAVDVSVLEATVTRCDASRKKARFQIAVRGAVAIILEKAASRASSYILDLKNKVKCWGSIPAVVKQKLEAVEGKTDRQGGVSGPGPAGGAGGDQAAS